MNELILNLFSILGLEPKDGKVYDTDRNAFLIFHGGNLIISNTIIKHKRDVEFDPLSNTKLAEYLLTVLFAKEGQDNGLFVLTYGLEDIILPYDKIKVFRCSVSTNNGNLLSDRYYNPSLAYIDIMYMLTGMPKPNLHMWDYTKQHVLERMAKKK